ncbi:hypothetical protein [Leptospira borgpetersenii]|uniref:hypothetical protein n=1 Tax=Leptospira borgpetersenii TaxID=174 RepID=UPI00188282E5|nr:hypothetical protein [Leptospira borgpetersenii]MBE8206441.1 hypothetical protein [Leptospira borgpetersenii serovar Ballum]MBE8315190.1 hypothetical protein [Leptospira borgpetersenii serovar Ballum]
MNEVQFVGILSWRKKPSLKEWNLSTWKNTMVERNDRNFDVLHDKNQSHPYRNFRNNPMLHSLKITLDKTFSTEKTESCQVPFEYCPTEQSSIYPF